MNIILSKKTTLLSGGQLEYLLIKDSHYNEDIGKYESYGLQVIYKDGDIHENAVVCDISTEYEYVEKLFFTLVQADVMPVTLNDIVYDYICYVNS